MSRHRKVEPDSVFGDWKVVAHDRDDIFRVECSAGHKLLRAASLLLDRKLSNKCLDCRRAAANKELIGQTRGTLTCIGLVTRPLKKKSREGQNACYLVCRCTCGQVSEYLNREFRRGDVTGKACQGCREQKTKNAAAANLKLEWPDDMLAAVKTAIRTGIASVLVSADRQEADDVTGLVWAELLTYPNLAQKTRGQLAQTAHTLSKRISLSHILGIRERRKLEVDPPKSPTDESSDPDSCVFDNLNVDQPEKEASDTTEIQRLAFDLLPDHDRQFLLTFAASKNVKSRNEKARYAALAAQCRENYASLTAEIGVSHAA